MKGQRARLCLVGALAGHLSAFAQDSHLVAQPALPPACAVLIAQFAHGDDKLAGADDQQRIQQALDHCKPGHSVHLAPSNEWQVFVSGPVVPPPGVTLVVDPGATLYPSADAAKAAAEDSKKRGPGRAVRPQLSASQVQRYSRQEVLAYAGPPGRETRDPWDPERDVFELRNAPADYEVGPTDQADGQRRFDRIQAAVNRAVLDAQASGRSRRIVIRIQPGIYRELVYVPALNAPIALVGAGSKPENTLISAKLDASVSGLDYAASVEPQFRHVAPDIRAMFDEVRARSNITTFGSATVWSKNPGFALINLTIENAYQRETTASPGPCVEDCRTPQPTVQHQAVALMLDGADKSVAWDVELRALQDTPYLKNPADGSTARSYFHHARIVGDVDFIFGDATAYFDQSEIVSLGSRKESYVAAPSTDLESRYGFVFDHCEFKNDGSPLALQGRYRLARQWFHNQRCTPYGTVPLEGYACSLGPTDQYATPRGTISVATLRHVGKMVVLNSVLGSHISATHPWAEWNQSGKLSHRPVQRDAQDFSRHLKAALPGVEAAYFSEVKFDDLLPFLAEFNNTPAANTGANL